MVAGIDLRVERAVPEEMKVEHLLGGEVAKVNNSWYMRINKNSYLPPDGNIPMVELCCIGRIERFPPETPCTPSCSAELFVKY